MIPLENKALADCRCFFRENYLDLGVPEAGKYKSYSFSVPWRGGWGLENRKNIFCISIRNKNF